MIKINVFARFLVLRVILLLGICLVFALVFMNSDWIFTQLILGSLIILLIFEINRYVHKTNEHVRKFAESLKYGEFNSSLSIDSTSPKFRTLIHEFNMIKSQYESLQQDYKAEKNILLKVINEQKAGILIYDEWGKVHVQSENLLKMLDLPFISSMDHIYRILPDLHTRLEECSDSGRILLRKEDMNYSINKDYICSKEKFKTNDNELILLAFSEFANEDSGSDYNEWTNFGKVISHEILNGITPILSTANHLKDKVNQIEDQSLKANMEKAFKIIIDRCESMRQFSEKYRTMIQIPEPDRTILNWRNLLEESIFLHQSELDANKVEIEILGDGIDNAFRGDKNQLEQVFSNLLLNSLHSLQQDDNSNRKIKIKIESELTHFKIKYSDNGLGIPKELRSKVFVPFFTTKESGSGIGLSVIKQILWKHGAEIFLSSEGSGCLFVIKYPQIV